MSRRSTAQKKAAADDSGSRVTRLNAIMNLLGTCKSNTVDADLRAMLNRQMSFHRNLLLDQVDYSQSGTGGQLKGTLLHWSVSTLPVAGRKAVIQWLLDEGLFIDDTDSDGFTPLQRVVLKHIGYMRGNTVEPGALETAVFLVDRGADLVVEHPTTKLTVLETVITCCPRHMIANAQAPIKALKDAQVKYKGNLKQEGPAPKRRRMMPLLTLWSSSSSSSAAVTTGEAEAKMGDVSQLYLTGMYTDVTLAVGKQKLKAHKQVLAERSEYFKVMLGDGKRWKESGQSEPRDHAPRGRRSCPARPTQVPVQEQTGADGGCRPLCAVASGSPVPGLDGHERLGGWRGSRPGAEERVGNTQESQGRQCRTSRHSLQEVHPRDIVQMHNAVFDEEEKEELWSALKQGGKYRLPRV